MYLTRQDLQATIKKTNDFLKRWYLELVEAELFAICIIIPSTHLVNIGF